jgi:hypothetical protein
MPEQDKTTERKLPPELAEITPPVQLRMSKLISYIMYAWVMFGVVMLSLRVFLLIFSANASAPFVNFVLRTSDDYLRPFAGIFPARQLSETGYFDVAALFAICIYLILGWLTGALIAFVQGKIDQNDQEQRRRLHYLQQEEADEE